MYAALLFEKKKHISDNESDKILSVTCYLSMLSKILKWGSQDAV